MKETIIAVGVVAVLLLAIPAMSLFNISFWGPKIQNAQTKVFENTNAYVRGNQRDFENLVLQYRTEKDPDSKAAILSTIRQRAYGIPPEQVPADVRQLINQ